ncbi:MAG TPA: LCP family protein [Chloroflexota bacterium]|nr:LCP family protein [Chloroflexota bacterium]
MEASLGAAPRTTLTSGGAALRSALVPGWGQWAARRRARGLLLLGLALATLAATALTALGMVRGLLPLPPLLAGVAGLVGELPLRLLDRVLAGDWGAVWRGFLALNVLVLLIRIWAAVDASLCVSRAPGTVRPVRSMRSTAGATGAALVLALPHAIALGLALWARPILNQVFVTKLPATVAAPAPVAPGEPAPEPDPGRPTWDGASRLNVLLMGVDRRPNQTTDGPRGNSDTLLLVSIDPLAHTAAMVSIPRDLYLPIPGLGQEKINAAYREVGPELSVRVVGDLVGQPVHRWASIEIPAFARTIDAIGGVLVDVERPIRDDEYPAENFAIRRIFLPAGLQWLNGEEALWYARSRHGSNDFDRAARQQALLLALKERARDRRTLAMATTLIQSLADAVQTDLTPRELLALSRLGGSSDFRSARLVLTPPAFGSEINRPNLYAIVPNLPRIRAAVADTLAGLPASGVLGGVPAQGGGDAGPDPAPDEMPDDGEDVP